MVGRVIHGLAYPGNALVSAAWDTRRKHSLHWQHRPSCEPAVLLFCSAPLPLISLANAASSTSGDVATPVISTSAGAHACGRAFARNDCATNVGDARAGAVNASVAPGARTGFARLCAYVAYDPPLIHETLQITA